MFPLFSRYHDLSSNHETISLEAMSTRHNCLLSPSYLSRRKTKVKVFFLSLGLNPLFFSRSRVWKCHFSAFFPDNFSLAPVPFHGEMKLGQINVQRSQTFAALFACDNHSANRFDCCAPISELLYLTLVACSPTCWNFPKLAQKQDMCSKYVN